MEGKQYESVHASRPAYIIDAEGMNEFSRWYVYSVVMVVDLLDILRVPLLWKLKYVCDKEQ